MLHGGSLNSTVYNLLSTEEKISQSIKQNPTIELVDNLLCSGIQIHASDIHLQPEDGFARIRYRVDGTLYDQDKTALDILRSAISRVKILAGMDIATQRLPQDGKIKILQYNQLGQQHIIDLRISTFPSTYGEKMVIRILDREYNLLNLETLGFSKSMFEAVKNLIDRPHGFFLVTGPTGAGKTTTLYAMLSYLNKPGKNILTMEDPVEYAIEGITQSQVNEKSGFIFQNGLRSLLRQDPDIIMIGEIRDKVTAQIAIEAALTGHLVLSTLHTNDAAGAITRLLDMGVEPFLISATLSGVIAQRLARKLCSNCKQEVTNASRINKSVRPDPARPELVEGVEGFTERTQNMPNFEQFTGKVYSAPGCSKCFNLGHKGRIGIFELLVLDEKIKDLITQKASNEDIQKHALSNGMLSLQNDGIQKLNLGQISFEEFLANVEV